MFSLTGLLVPALLSAPPDFSAIDQAVAAAVERK